MENIFKIIKEIKQTLENVDKRSNYEFERVKRIDERAKEILEATKRIEVQEKRVDSMLAKMDERMKGMVAREKAIFERERDILHMERELEKRLIGLEKKIDTIDKRVEQIDKNTVQIDKKTTQIDKNVGYEKYGLSRKINEISWGMVFNSMTHDSEWLLDKNFAPGRWAVGYGYLYVMYRVLNQIKPQSILELGLGQSTKMITQYAKCNSVEHYVVEHDAVWIDFFKKEHDIAKNTTVVQLDREMIDYNDVKDVRVFAGFTEKFAGKKFSYISIDAPLGGDMKELSRIDVLRLLPECLNDTFVITFDDVNRVGEANTAEEITRVLTESGIKFKTSLYKGETDFRLWCSEDVSFLCTL